jgi:hypothetical protein
MRCNADLCNADFWGKPAFLGKSIESNKNGPVNMTGPSALEN